MGAEPTNHPAVRKIAFTRALETARRVMAVDDPLVASEQFGPTVPLLTYTDIDEAVDRANAFALRPAASVWGANAELVERLARRLEVGTTCINSHNRHGINPGAPFRGHQVSGFGREYGDAGLDRTEV